MKQRTSDNITALVAGILVTLCLVVATDANATGNKDPRVVIDAEQSQDQSQVSTATANSDSVSTASNDGVTVEGDTLEISETSTVENNSSNVVLVPNNNTESCLRVIGIAWGKSGESGALGWPYRSKKCDYEQAADDAFAAGERETGWFWKCQNKNLYKSFRSKGESDESAKADCHTAMVGEVTKDKTIERLDRNIKMLNDERRHELVNYEERLDQQKQLCDESKDRLVKGCNK